MTEQLTLSWSSTVFTSCIISLTAVYSVHGKNHARSLRNAKIKETVPALIEELGSWPVGDWLPSLGSALFFSVSVWISHLGPRVFQESFLSGPFFTGD